MSEVDDNVKILEDSRITAISKFMTGMTDIKIRRHPQRQLVYLTLCDVTRDHYGDSYSIPIKKFRKLVILQKNTNLDYINMNFGILLDDGNDLPWVMILTLSGLPRTLRHGDYVTLISKEGESEQEYKVSCVKPVNRDNPNIIECFLHPTRDNWESAKGTLDGSDFVPLFSD